MMTTRHLSWVWTPWSLALSLLALAVTAALCYIAWRRSGYRRSIGILEAIRFLLVLGAVLLLNQPEWTELYRPSEKPTVLVLQDATRSMDTRDVLPSGSVSGQAITRREAVSRMSDPSTWDSLKGRMQVITQSFGTERSQGTDLYVPLAEAPDRYRNLMAIVLISDGDWNEGLPPVQAATSLRLRNVPVLAVPMGSSSRLPDVELLSFDVPTFGIINKAVRIPITVESSLPREHQTTVVLKASNGDEVKHELRIAAMGRTTDAILWKPQSEGQFTLSLTIPSNAQEVILDNNQREAPITIRQEKLKVLVVESTPRWEYRYLRNALSRDPGVEVSCLLFHPGLSKTGGGNRDYIAQFPETLEALSQYDVVFIGDVGTDEQQLTPEQCRLLKGLVEHQASGLVFMPGAQGRQFSLVDTPLGDLMPVIFDDAQLNGWGSRTPNQFELTETGRRSLLTKLADTPDENLLVWENLPGFQWYAPVLRAKPGTEVLCVHQEATNQYGRLPLLATRTFGAGKVLFMGTDGAWRWRKGVEDLYHYRFWGQVVRWMAYQRHMAHGETMRMYYTPEQPQIGQTVSLSANVMEANGEPLETGQVSVRIVAPSGKAETLRFSAAGHEWGAFTAQYVPAEPGPHSMTLFCKETGATLESTLFVQGALLERLGKPARPEVLEEIARVSRGEVIAADKLEQVVQTLSALPDPPPVIRRVQLWSHPFAAGLWLVLVTVFWVGRKVAGLI